MFGRAGRGGNSARAHLFFSTKQKLVDKDVREFCQSKENCLRASILRLIGNTVAVETSSPCCSNCSSSSGVVVPQKLQVIEAKPTADPKRKKRKAYWSTSKDLEDEIKRRLKEERTKFIIDHPSFLIVGEMAVCPDCVIDCVCRDARFVKSKQDLSTVSGLRSELQDAFLHVIDDVMSTSPINAKKQRIT